MALDVSRVRDRDSFAVQAASLQRLCPYESRVGSGAHAPSPSPAVQCHVGDRKRPVCPRLERERADDCGRRCRFGRAGRPVCRGRLVLNRGRNRLVRPYARSFGATPARSVQLRRRRPRRTGGRSAVHLPDRRSSQHLGRPLSNWWPIPRTCGSPFAPIV